MKLSAGDKATIVQYIAGSPEGQEPTFPVLVGGSFFGDGCGLMTERAIALVERESSGTEFITPAVRGNWVHFIMAITHDLSKPAVIPIGVRLFH